MSGCSRVVVNGDQFERFNGASDQGGRRKTRIDVPIKIIPISDTDVMPSTNVVG